MKSNNAPNSPGPLAVSIRSLTKTFRARSGASLTALQNVSLDIRQGDFVSIVGLSGCGKSTLLNMTCGLVRPSSGVIFVEGSEMVTPRPATIGYIQQDPVLLPWRTVWKNILLPMEVRRLKAERTELETRARELLAAVDLERFADSYPRELSGGMQQRVALVRTLAYAPHIILMDEPFGALDEFTREAMNVELLALWKSALPTVMFVTHSIPEAVFLSDRVIVMSARPGQIAADVRIDLPRPRQPGLAGSSEFNDHVQRVRKFLISPATHYELEAQ